MRKLLVVLVLLIASAAEAKQKYWYPIGQDDQGRTTYRSSIKGRDGLYYPDPEDSNLYTLERSGPTQEQMNWLMVGAAVNGFQQNYNQQLQTQAQLIDQEQMLDRVLDRQRALDSVNNFKK